MILAVSMLTYEIFPALAAGPYRMVLRYYDRIQITYEIKYPVGDSRGLWEGPEDVPIGGAGYAGSDDFDIVKPYVSTQVYCVPVHTVSQQSRRLWRGN